MILPSVLGYLLVAAAVGTALYRILDHKFSIGASYGEDWIIGIPILVGLFWPLAVPIGVVVWLTYKAVGKFLPPSSNG